MDRKIIILTPSEWENRTNLAELAQTSYDHNHFNKDAQLIIRSLVTLSLMHILDGNMEAAVKGLEKIPNMCQRIYEDSCRAQDGIGELAKLIGYQLEMPKAIDPTA